MTWKIYTFQSLQRLRSVVQATGKPTTKFCAGTKVSNPASTIYIARALVASFPWHDMEILIILCRRQSKYINCRIGKWVEINLWLYAHACVLLHVVRVIYAFKEIKILLLCRQKSRRKEIKAI